MNRNSLGRKGEEAAARFLTKKGIKVIKSNFHTPFGEIDIIGKRKNKLYFIEVKTRKSLECGSPLEAISTIKKEHMVKSALFFLKGSEEGFEIGVVSVIERNGEYEIEYINDIF